MFAHLFKLIWNKKKQNALLLSEMLFSFLVIFAVFCIVVYYFQNYKKPAGFNYEDVWVINYNNTLQTSNTDSLAQFYETIRQTIKSMPQVKEISFTSDNVPFSNNHNQTGVANNNIKEGHVNQYIVEDGYINVLSMQVTEGRWYNKGDVTAKDKPVVINTTLKEILFGKDAAVGKMITEGDNKLKVIGVLSDAKTNGDYVSPGTAVFKRLDTSAFHWLGHILVKVGPSADAAFESRLYKTMANAMKNANVEIEQLTDKRRAKNKTFIIPLIVILVVACFLVINVALGLFGVLWYNINKRRGEIGLRRAVGAPGSSVSFQLVAEALILATLSLIIGSFFAIQFPLLNVGNISSGVYLSALALAILFIYLLVLVCSLYPGKQAAAIYPAVALHED